MTLHKIKLAEKYCDDVLSGRKTFEIRLNDRNYQVGDIVRFIPINHDETLPLPHDIKNKTYAITYIITDKEFLALEDNYCVFSIMPVAEMESEE